MNLLFVIKSLNVQGGGAERVLVDVVNDLVRRGNEAHVLTCDSPEEGFYTLDPKVRRLDTGIGQPGHPIPRSGFFRAMPRIRRIVRATRPDIVVAFMHSSYLPVGIALTGSGIPMIASEHTSAKHYQSVLLEKLLLQLTPLISKRTTVVSAQVLTSFGWWLRRRMIVIPNPVSLPANKRPCDVGEDPARTKTLLSVGGLKKKKNQQCLIAAFAEVSSHVPNWKLRIAGEGELREALEAQVHSLGLSDKVELPGAVADIGLEYAQSDLFVLPSTYESFGLATAEALLHGLPAIGFADCPGTNSLIRNGENGVLVDGSNRVENLAATLRELMASPQELKRLSNASTDWLESQFNIDAVVDSWESLIQDVVDRK